MPKKESIHHPASPFLRYEIREIVEVANELKEKGKEITWENIGDPVARGHRPPDWIRDILVECLQDPESFAYGPSQGLLESREFLSSQTNQNYGTSLKAEDIVFFNGVGDAIATLYRSLDPQARILLPSPVYPTHFALEAFHSHDNPIQYELNPKTGWSPDLAQIRKSLELNPQIVGLLLVNPDNPTGSVHSREVLEEFVSLAREFHVFLIVDEIYAGIQIDSEHDTKIAGLLDDVPAILLQGISKLLPWPGGRCGWMEFHHHGNSNLLKLLDTVNAHKRLEVGSTTLPQKILPQVLGDSRLQIIQSDWTHFLKKRIHTVENSFGDIQGLELKTPKGAFYATPYFDKEQVDDKFFVPMEARYHQVIQPYGKGASEDKKFVLQCMAGPGICVVPLSSFHTQVQGFRMTLLERDDREFDRICAELRRTLLSYLNAGLKKKEGLPAARTA